MQKRRQILENTLIVLLSVATAALLVRAVHAMRPAPHARFADVILRPPSPDQLGYIVDPYYVYPSDQPRHPEYEKAARALTIEIQQWYKARVGTTFTLGPFRTVQAKDDYLHMKCGENPTADCIAGKDPLDRCWHNSYWSDSVGRAIGGYRPHHIAWVFAQGGGGWACGTQFGDYQGFGIFGDWVLEPISGVPNPAGLPCAGHATWECRGGTPKGTTAHELGHAFGLYHPDGYPGKSIMRHHWDYPNTNLLPQDLLILKSSPYFVGSRFMDKGAPVLSLDHPAYVYSDDKTLTLKGKGFRPGDRGLFTSPAHRFSVVPIHITPTALTLPIPVGVGPGTVRVLRGRLRSNALPINGYAHHGDEKKEFP